MTFDIAGTMSWGGSVVTPPYSPVTISTPVVSEWTDTSVRVTWDAAPGATGQVEYGVTDSYGSVSALETAYLTTHSQVITGLSPSALYHFRVKAVAVDGLVFYSDDDTFTTNPTPASTSTYGPGFAQNALQNINIGQASGGVPVMGSYRFKALYTGTLLNGLIYIIGVPHPGYALGDGGILQPTLYTDDGAGNPASQVANGACSPLVSPATSAQTVITWPTPPSVVAGQIYHIRFHNSHANPTANYSAIDCTYTDFPTDPYQPRFANTDMAALQKGSGAWAVRPEATPIFSLAYGGAAAGQHQGQGYMATWGDYGTELGIVIDGTQKIRERFTVTGTTRHVTGLWVRMAKTGGSAPLTCRLETSAGVEVVTVSTPAASINTASRGNNGTYFLGQRWVFVSLGGTYTLTLGQTYHLQLSTSVGTTYWLNWIVKGIGYGYDPATYFSDGYAQTAPDGSTWGNVKAMTTNNPLPWADLQHYWVTV